MGPLCADNPSHWRAARRSHLYPAPCNLEGLLPVYWISVYALGADMKELIAATASLGLMLSLGGIAAKHPCGLQTGPRSGTLDG